MRRNYRTEKSVACSEKLLEEFLALVPGATVRNEAVTTSSIYVKTPDGYSLRIGDHPGREKYKYKYNLGPQFAGRRRWEHDDGHWRYYSDRPADIAAIVERNMKTMEDIPPPWAVEA